jgi:predicted transposase/invertase (TIGR01784 family)
VFVELPKFDRSLEELITITDKWIYFLQHAPDLETVPDTMGEVLEIQQAFELANEALLTPEELEELEHQQFFIYDQLGAITYAAEQGLKKGLEQGLEQGKQVMQRSIAQKLLSTLDDATIAQTTGLSVEEVRSLRKS